MGNTLTRMIFAVVALAASAAVLAGSAAADTGQRHVASQPAGAVVVPYLSQGVGVDASQFSGEASPHLGGVHAALLARHSPPTQARSLGLNGDSPLTRVSAPEPAGLTGDGALTRIRKPAPVSTVSGGNDVDWTSFAEGAGTVALLAAALAGVLFTVRRRHTVGMP